MGSRVIVLNGGSSSGKSTIARCLQDRLPSPWLVLGVDDLIGAMPRNAIAEGSRLALGAHGEVVTGPA
jgi:chloramphenicol 3-O phosphotransferase